jgi:hypothetical protein
MKKVFFLSILSLFLFACSEDEDNNTTPASPTTNNTQGNNGGNNNQVFDNSYMFSDDNIMCTPSSVNMMNIGILSVISNPCQNSSSKLDGYFNGRPEPGTYMISPTMRVPNAFTMGSTRGELIFYNHGDTTLFSTGGTIVVTKNQADTNLIDINWTDVDMTYAGSTTVIQFSGNLNGL